MQQLLPYVVLKKQRGETPLQCIEVWKGIHPEYTEIPATYAGRLDPMAEGKLLVLLGEECKKQKNYQGLDKEYVVEVLFDISTDTGDVLGLAEYTNIESIFTEQELAKANKSVEGSHSVPYPAYSSKTVGGKSLFLHTLENTLGEKQIPEHIETIYSSKIISAKTYSKRELQKRISESLELVPRTTKESLSAGKDFRQDEIRDRWKALFEEIPDRHFTVVTLRVTCASGAYMRTLAERIAKNLGTRALALSITRTKIGRYGTLGPLEFWYKQY